jgi:NTE family protein
MADFTLPRSGLVIGQELVRFLKSILGDVTFSDLATPFACVATDILTGQEVVLKDGPVAEAVRASLSLPFFFQPYYKDGRYLVDGGLVNPVPTSIIVNLGADILLSVNLTSKPSEKRVPRLMGWRRQLPADLRGPNVIEIMMKTIYTMQHEIAQWRSEIAHVVMEPDMSEFTWMEFHRSDDISKYGEACAEEALPKIKSLIPFFAASSKIPAPTPARKSF